jgi:hypothetical protein
MESKVKKLDKALSYIKKYWYLVLLTVSGAAIVLSYIVFKGKSKALIDAFMKNRQGYIEQINKIEKVHELEKRRTDEAFENFRVETEVLEDEHKAEVISIEKAKEKRIKELSGEDSEVLADSLKDEFDL